MKAILIMLLLVTSSRLWAHSEESVGPSSVGPDKGVLKVDEHDGFMLRPSAEGNFSIQKTQLKAGPAWTIPASSLVYSGLETQVLRQREGYWKAVDVDVVRKSGANLEIRSKDLAAGDLLATHGIGFLKIIEQSVMGPHKDDHHDE
jgi:hypothetical protein